MKIMLGAPDRQVRDPITRALVPPEGREVNENDLYWARRLRDGDVVPADPDPPRETRKQEA
jgi:Protein of unknown function (DUF2635)